MLILEPEATHHTTQSPDSSVARNGAAPGADVDWSFEHCCQARAASQMLVSYLYRPLAHALYAWRRLGAAAELLGGATHGRLLDTLGELEAVADDDDFLAAAGALRTILEE